MRYFLFTCIVLWLAFLGDLWWLWHGCVEAPLLFRSLTVWEGIVLYTCASHLSLFRVLRVCAPLPSALILLFPSVIW